MEDGGEDGHKVLVYIRSHYINSFQFTLAEAVLAYSLRAVVEGSVFSHLNQALFTRIVTLFRRKVLFLTLQTSLIYAKKLCVLTQTT